MFGIGMPEMLVILALALIIIGPKKLPDLAKSLGRAMREFKKATNEFKETIQLESELSEVKETFNDISDGVKDAIDLNLGPEKKKSEKNGSDDEEKGKKDDEQKTESQDFGKLNNLKKEFDKLDTPTDTSGKDENMKQDSSPDTEVDQKDKSKGSDDDA